MKSIIDTGPGQNYPQMALQSKLLSMKLQLAYILAVEIDGGWNPGFIKPNTTGLGRVRNEP